MHLDRSPLTNGSGSLDINDDAELDINEIIIGIGKESPPPRIAPVHCAAGSDGDTNFGVTSLAAPNAASSESRQILPRGAARGLSEACLPLIRCPGSSEFFYSFRLDEAVPDDHPVRAIAAVLDLSWVHAELTPFYPKIGRPSIDPVLMIRMLIVGDAFAIRSERALCREMRADLAYRRICGLSIEDKIADPCH